MRLRKKQSEITTMFGEKIIFPLEIQVPNSLKDYRKMFSDDLNYSVIDTIMDRITKDETKRKKKENW